MKRIVVTILLLLLILSGCTMAKEAAPRSNRNKGIIYNKYQFERLKLQDAPQTIKDMYEGNKKDKKVITTDDNGYTYIIALAGEKPTAGYDVKVVSIEDIEEGKLKVTVEFIEPKKGSLVAQVITYPVDIVRMNKVGLPVYALDTEGNIINVEKK